MHALCSVCVRSSRDFLLLEIFTARTHIINMSEVCMQTGSGVCVHLCICIHIHTYIYIHIYTYTYIYIHMYLHTYNTYIHTYIQYIQYIHTIHVCTTRNMQYIQPRALFVCVHITTHFMRLCTYNLAFHSQHIWSYQNTLDTWYKYLYTQNDTNIHLNILQACNDQKNTVIAW